MIRVYCVSSISGLQGLMCVCVYIHYCTHDMLLWQPKCYSLSSHSWTVTWWPWPWTPRLDNNTSIVLWVLWLVNWLIDLALVLYVAASAAHLYNCQRLSVRPLVSCFCIVFVLLVVYLAGITLSCVHIMLPRWPLLFIPLGCATSSLRVIRMWQNVMFIEWNKRELN